MNELYAFVIQKWTWGTRKSNKKEGKLKHWLTSAYLFQFIFWPSKIKIVCLSRVNDFYDNHRFMFSAVYIFCVRSRMWGRDIRDASDLINLYICICSWLIYEHCAIWTSVENISHVHRRMRSRARRRTIEHEFLGDLISVSRASKVIFSTQIYDVIKLKRVSISSNISFNQILVIFTHQNSIYRLLVVVTLYKFLRSFPFCHFAWRVGKI